MLVPGKYYPCFQINISFPAESIQSRLTLDLAIYCFDVLNEDSCVADPTMTLGMAADTPLHSPVNPWSWNTDFIPWNMLSWGC